MAAPAWALVTGLCSYPNGSGRTLLLQSVIAVPRYKCPGRYTMRFDCLERAQPVSMLDYVLS